MKDPRYFAEKKAKSLLKDVKSEIRSLPQYPDFSDAYKNKVSLGDNVKAPLKMIGVGITALRRGIRQMRGEASESQLKAKEKKLKSLISNYNDMKETGYFTSDGRVVDQSGRDVDPKTKSKFSTKRPK